MGSCGAQKQSTVYLPIHRRRPEQATAKYVTLAFCFELKALGKQQMQEGLSYLPPFCLKAGHKFSMGRVPSLYQKEVNIPTAKMGS